MIAVRPFTLDQKILLRGCLHAHGFSTPPNIDTPTLHLCFHVKFGKGLAHVFKLNTRNPVRRKKAKNLPAPPAEIHLNA